MRKIIFLIIVGLCVGVYPARAEHLITVDQALEQLFRKHQSVEKEETVLSAEQMAAIEQQAGLVFQSTHSNQIILYKIIQKDGSKAYAYEDTVIGKWGPIHYLVGIDQSKRIAGTIILDFYEIRGNPVKRKRFLRQYKGKSIKDPLRIRKDITGVSGATITSKSLTDGIRKILHIHNSIIH